MFHLQNVFILSNQTEQTFVDKNIFVLHCHATLCKHRYNFHIFFYYEIYLFSTRNKVQCVFGQSRIPRFLRIVVNIITCLNGADKVEN